MLQLPCLHAAGGGDNPAGVDDKDLVKYADVGATHYFNKNMSTYVDYKINCWMKMTVSTLPTASLPMILSCFRSGLSVLNPPARCFGGLFLPIHPPLI